MVLIDEPAQNIAAVDLPPGHILRVQAGTGRVKGKCPVRSRPVVVLGVRAEDSQQVASAEDENVVQALPSSTADPTFGHSVGFRRADGRLHHREPIRSEDLIERTGEFRVSVLSSQAQDQISNSGFRSVSPLAGI
jgi:flavin reductase (DIM6/NTAB) family NADH-FMN oxidoreductase RutF